MVDSCHLGTLIQWAGSIFCTRRLEMDTSFLPHLRAAALGVEGGCVGLWLVRAVMPFLL